MTLSPDLMKAILSLDAYNRGYDSALLNLQNVQDAQIGNASIILDSSIFQSGTDRLFPVRTYETE